MINGHKACPFCGRREARMKHSAKWGSFASCRCTAVGPSRKAPEAAWEAWDARPEPKPDNQTRLF